jgi:zinc protease
VSVARRADRSRLPGVGPPPAFSFSTIHKHTLPNRLSLWSSEHCSTFMLVLPSGSAADFEGFEGLAAITADMIDEGTGNLSAIDVNGAFARLGAHIDTDVSADATVFSVTGRSCRLCTARTHTRIWRWAPKSRCAS